MDARSARSPKHKTDGGHDQSTVTVDMANDSRGLVCLYERTSRQRPYCLPAGTNSLVGDQCRVMLEALPPGRRSRVRSPSARRHRCSPVVACLNCRERIRHVKVSDDPAGAAAADLTSHDTNGEVDGDSTDQCTRGRHRWRVRRARWLRWLLLSRRFLKPGTRQLED